MGEIVVLKKVNKLDRLKVSPNLYKINSDNIEDEGELDGVYKGNTFIGSKRNITPTWDRLKDQWAFDGTWEDLKNIQNKLRLRDEKGKFIEITEDTLRNKLDPFWANSLLWTTKIMEEGSTSLNSDSPLEDLLMRVHRGSSNIKKAGSEQSPYLIADASFELISPKQEDEVRSKAGKKEIDAVVSLSNMSADKMHAIAYLMQVPGYSPDERDSDVVRNTLLYGAAKNTENYYKYGTNVTYQDRFIELSKYTNEKLNILEKVQKGLDRGGIVVRPSSGYTFNGEKIDGGNIRTLKQLHDYYLSPKNQPAREELDNFLAATDENYK
jgi:hypothetical protein